MLQRYLLIVLTSLAATMNPKLTIPTVNIFKTC